MHNIVIYDYVAYTYDIDISLCNALRSGTLHMLGDVEFTECSQPWHHVLIGQLQDADRIAVLNGGVVSVQVFQECKECVQPNIGDSNLYDSIHVKM